MRFTLGLEPPASLEALSPIPAVTAKLVLTCILLCLPSLCSRRKYSELNAELDLLDRFFDHTACLPMRGTAISRLLAAAQASTGSQAGPKHVDSETTRTLLTLLEVQLPKVIKLFKQEGTKLDPAHLLFNARLLATERDPDGNINYLASHDAAGSGFVIETQVPRCEDSEPI